MESEYQCPYCGAELASESDIFECEGCLSEICECCATSVGGKSLCRDCHEGEGQDVEEDL